MPLPVAGVMARAMPAPRVARDLVPVVALGLETPLDMFDHVGGKIFVTRAHSTARKGPTEGRPGLEGELIGRHVLRAMGDQIVEIAVEQGKRLPREGEDQVEGEVREARSTRGMQRRMRDLCAMRPAQALQMFVLKRLDTDREPIDSRGAEGR